MVATPKHLTGFIHQQKRAERVQHRDVFIWNAIH